MTSIRANFLVLSALIITVVLVLAGFIFVKLFSQNLERRVHDELKEYVNQLAAEIDFSPDSVLRPPKGMSDLRFDHAYSGLYWQIDYKEAGKQKQLRSKSLWDTVLPLPDHLHDIAAVHEYLLPGPDNTMVIVQERTLVAAAPDGSRMLRIAAGMDQAVVTTARNQFFTDMVPYLVALGILLLLGAVFLVKFGLRSLDRVESALEDVKNRKKNSIEGQYPIEISRLTDAINGLLASQTTALEQVRKRSGDLAHSLKTPLTAIRTNAEKFIVHGKATIGDEIIDFTDQMEANIKRELVRSKLAPAPQARKSDAELVKITNDIVKTLKRIPHGEHLTWDIKLPEQCLIAMDPHDLRELLGNIIENASKWASSTVRIRGEKKEEISVFKVTVEDDGPGIEAAKIASMMEHGKRFDESTPGSGIGLSIVREISDLYSVPLAIQNRQTHGLSITISLPLAEELKN